MANSTLSCSHSMGYGVAGLPQGPAVQPAHQDRLGHQEHLQNVGGCQNPQPSVQGLLCTNPSCCVVIMGESHISLGLVPIRTPALLAAGISSCQGQPLPQCSPTAHRALHGPAPWECSPCAGHYGPGCSGSL